MKYIVLITNMDAQIEQQWLAVLQKRLHNEKILLPDQITAVQAQQIDIAIVANPDPKVVARFPNLIWIQSLWVGVEKLITTLPLDKIKLVKLNDPHLTQTMAEAVLAWTLYLQRNMPEYTLQQAQKKWQPIPYKSPQETRVSILGAGTLSMAAVNILNRHGYPVCCWSRSAKKLTSGHHFTGKSGLQSMLRKTDILINLLPLTPTTHHLIDDNLLKNLPKGSRFINFSRAAVVDTKALLALLDESHIAHAVLDVFDQEPLPVTSKIWQHSNITVLPHISGPTDINSAAGIVAENIKNYRATNIIPDAVDSEQGY
ncbi:D-isomer specific 2-hydroxyacid dehydrogenase, NAD-binding protein [Psychromonas ingrahamii 37]|uniref:D-isomer specific 2-hydroxyacid dehydrogenase, NAD-binding protein n=1 Tax=Psychromonas ingrahamii (strain DSM 17664 / CCUG 51855 / 37) TaxID=357804 RepID=A1SWL2_PSYIN|nr:glyoxylate/hydroxypyruvate reductase A [Psychromonas ingrahamii]ABM03877.1 D-isomer specific 2-hydroxyacid dehydrogenase, NAD-binding protein [Psychromonas ingrahamii 37]